MKTKIILETGCNHQGEIEIAKRMIKAAAMLGVWAIKFQKRDIESISEDVKLKPRDMSNSFGHNYYEHRKALEFDTSQLLELKIYAENCGLVFMCSAFDEQSIKDLIYIGCQWIKLPSQLYSDLYLKLLLIDLREKHNFKILVSTGMHDFSEITNSQWKNNADIIFHCVSIYPHDIAKSNLSTIANLINLTRDTRTKIGYSSHDKDGKAIPYAICSGAEYVERHFTLDKTMKGNDHATVSSDREDMKRIIESINIVEAALGDYQREVSEDEKKVRKIYRGF